MGQRLSQLFTISKTVRWESEKTPARILDCLEQVKKRHSVVNKHLILHYSFSSISIEHHIQKGRSQYYCTMLYPELPCGSNLIVQMVSKTFTLIITLFLVLISGLIAWMIVSAILAYVIMTFLYILVMMMTLGIVGRDLDAPSIGNYFYADLVAENLLLITSLSIGFGLLISLAFYAYRRMQKDHFDSLLKYMSYLCGVPGEEISVSTMESLEEDSSER